MREKNGYNNQIVLEITGVEYHYETIEAFGESYFSQEYEQAFKVTDNIIKQSLKQREDMLQQGKYSELYNIVPFIGPRGSGKTSSMQSFLGALRNYSRTKSENERFTFLNWMNDNTGNNLIFTCLDCIDGSLLEKGEDIFRVILAQMYGKFLEQDKHGLIKDDGYDYNKDELLQTFDKIFRNISKIEYYNHNAYSEESSIVSLRNLSNSLELKESFAKLVKQYLNLLRYEKYETINRYDSKMHFLVISIEDMDLNIANGFEMLEKIHRYLMVPNVLILMSFDDKQLLGICEKHFYKMIPKVDQILVNKQEYVKELAVDFMDKVFPLSARIYMPSIQRQNTLGLKVNQNIVSLKQGILYLIFIKTGIRCDGAGRKRHFYEPDSIRNFVGFYTMLTEMVSLKECIADSGEFMRISLLNHKLLMADAISRLAAEKLEGARKKDFEKLIYNDISRSFRNFIFIVSRLTYEADHKYELIRKAVDAAEFYEYSYGEVLRTIYCVGRVDDEWKAFVQCLLAYYSIELTDLYQQYVLAKDNGVKKNKKQELLRILNGSFIGSWSNRIMPGVVTGTTVEGMQKKYLLGIRKIKNLQWVYSFSVKIDQSLKPFVSDNSIKLDAEAYKKDKRNAKAREHLKKIFRSLYALSMFFSLSGEDENSMMKWELTTSKSIPDGKKNITIKSSTSPAVFNILNFVVNAFCWREIYEEFEQSLFKVLFGEISTSTCDTISKDIGIKKEFEIWENYSGGLAIPFYQMDMCYNIMKRIRRTRYKDFEDRILLKDIFSYFEKLFADIERKLKEADEYYNFEKDLIEYEDMEESARPVYTARFSESFAHCPFVVWFRDRQNYFLPEFSEWMENMFNALSNAGEALDEPGTEMRNLDIIL